MRASSTHNPLSYYPKAPCRGKFLCAFHVCGESGPHISCRMHPRVCMPTSQCKSSLATGYFLFMWCGELVYKGTLRFGTRCLPDRFDAAALSLVDTPGSMKPHLLRGLRAGTVWRSLELLATQSASSHGGALYCFLSFGSQRAIFHPSLHFLFLRVKGVLVSRFLLSDLSFF